MKIKFFLFLGVFLLAMTVSAPRVFADTSTQIYGQIIGDDFSIKSCVEFLSSITNGNIKMYTPRPQDLGSYSPTNWPAHGNANINDSTPSSFCSTVDIFGADNFLNLWSGASSGQTYFFLYDVDHSNLPIGYISVVYDVGGSITPEGDNVDHSTRIVSVISPQNEIATSTSVLFSGTYYLSCDDASTTPAQYDFVPRVHIVLADEGFGTTSSEMNFPITVCGSIQSFSTTTSLLNNYRYAWTIGIQGNNREPLNSGLFPDGLNFWQFTTGTFDPTNGQNYDLSSCNVLSGFNAQTCIYNLIFPNNTIYSITYAKAKDSYGRAVPMGYVTRVIEILSTTTASSLPVIDATLPMFGNPHIRLDLSHSLDFVLNATTSSFINSSGSSDDTFYEITSYYWNLIVYLAMAFYLLTRILGSHIIGKLGHLIK